MTTLAARLFAQREGFGIKGAMPTRLNNPGDLRHAPGASHEPGNPDGIGAFKTVADGWAALDRQLALYAARGLTVQQAVYKFAPPSENNTPAYLAFICAGLHCFPTTPMSVAITITGDPSWTPSIKSAVGSPPAPSSGAPLLARLSPKSLLQSVTAIFSRPSVPNSVAPSLPSVSPSQGTSFQTALGVNSMANPAAPALIAVLQALETFINNMGTDPVQMPLKFPAALQILMGSIEMQLPAVAQAELGAVQTAINARIAALIAQLQAP